MLKSNRSKLCYLGAQGSVSRRELLCKMKARSEGSRWLYRAPGLGLGLGLHFKIMMECNYINKGVHA